jgi:hypothetical protein
VQSFENFYKETQLVEESIREAYVAEQYDLLIEKLITFGGKAYPKYGNVVIMAGGAGSGKGFVKDKLVGIDGKVFDVDELKRLASKTPAIVARVKKDLGVDLTKLASDLKDPENVAKLHEIIGDYLNISDRQTKALYQSILAGKPELKPNLIFDVTLKDLRKLQNITRQVSAMGYAKENIHIVWVVNDIEVAKKQNAERDRMVPVEILVNTHRGASQTMGDILNMGKGLAKYMDGDIVFAFNKIGVDSGIEKSERGGSYIKDANYFYVKKKGKQVTPVDQLNKDLRHKIAQYVPKGVAWE